MNTWNPFFLGDVDPAAAAFGAFGVAGVLIAIFAFVLAVAWLLLPFLILSSLGKLRDEIRYLSALTLEQKNAVEASKTSQASQVAEQQATNQHLQNLFDAATRGNQLLDWGAQTAAQHLPPP